MVPRQHQTAFAAWASPAPEEACAGKRRTELVGMQDRLLNGYLAGPSSRRSPSKAADLKVEIAKVEEALARASGAILTRRAGLGAIRLQQAARERWHRSKLGGEAAGAGFGQFEPYRNGHNFFALQEKAVRLDSRTAFLKNGRSAGFEPGPFDPSKRATVSLRPEMWWIEVEISKGEEVSQHESDMCRICAFGYVRGASIMPPH